VGRRAPANDAKDDLLQPQAPDRDGLSLPRPLSVPTLRWVAPVSGTGATLSMSARLRSVKASVALVHELVAGITAIDEQESAHRAQTLRWLEGTDDVFRRSKPDIPPRHLTSYVVLFDHGTGDVLLVDHRKADLWLPPGGHVDPDEHPALTVRRECHEELGFEPTLMDPAERPLFLTVTTTIGLDAGHTDVSLWYVCAGSRQMALRVDPSEFRAARWWSPHEIRASDPHTFDPRFLPFMTKLTGQFPIPTISP
jgi:8-oxo-dGTP diphosphatase